MTAYGWWRDKEPDPWPALDTTVPAPVLSLEKMREMYEACVSGNERPVCALVGIRPFLRKGVPGLSWIPDIDDDEFENGEMGEIEELLVTPKEYGQIMELDKQCYLGGRSSFALFDTHKWEEGMKGIVGEAVVQRIVEEKPEAVMLVVTEGTDVPVRDKPC